MASSHRATSASATDSDALEWSGGASHPRATCNRGSRNLAATNLNRSDFAAGAAPARVATAAAAHRARLRRQFPTFAGVLLDYARERVDELDRCVTVIVPRQRGHRVLIDERADSAVG